MKYGAGHGSLRRALSQNRSVHLADVARRRGRQRKTSARMEGPWPSAVQPSVEAWARGELTVDEVVAAGLAIVATDCV